MKKIFYFAMLMAMPAMAQQTVVSTFEDTNVTFNENNYWNGGKIGTPEAGDWGESTYHCKAESGLLTTTCDYSTMEGYDWWGGVALSQSVKKEFSKLDDQYNNIVGSGVNASKTFGVIYGGATIDVNVEGGAMISYLYVTNSAYTHNNFTVNTGSLDTKFTAAGDHIYLNIVANKADGTSKTAVVKLAEYTDRLVYLENWQRIELDTLGKDVVKLTFSFDCNKPMVATYACIDDIAVVAGANGVATFENLELDNESYWNGIDNSGSFVSGGFKFENGHEVYDYGEGNVFDYCYGFFYTNRTATTYNGNANTEQYNSAVGSGAEKSKTYAVFNVNMFATKGVEVLAKEGEVVSGFYVTNSAYSYVSMTQGDSYAKKFGKDDWFKLTVTGYDAAGAQTGTVDFYLADLRDDKQSYILNTWRWVDLTSLGKVKRLGFALSSTDNGSYGMNTPAYFCLDNLGGVKPEHEEPISGGIMQLQNSSNGLQQHYDLGGRKLGRQQKGLNIVRMADGTVRKVMVK